MSKQKKALKAAPAAEENKVVLAIRVTPEERDQIHDASRKVTGQRQAMASWVRDVLLSEAKRVLGK